MHLDSLAASDSKESIATLTDKGQGAAIIQTRTGLYSSGFVWSWSLYEEGLLCQSCAQLWEGICASRLWTARVKVASFTLSRNRSNTFLFEIQRECAEILF